jgi:hypothetical protein
MAESKIPYVLAYGNITRVLEKIQPAATPSRFTQDFLATKLNMTGGGAKSVIPYLKRTGFLASDGAPTERYKRFRSDATRGAAGAAALKQGYSALYELNEYAHALDDNGLKDLVVQVTGSEKTASVIPKIVKSFRALQQFADFDAAEGEQPDEPEPDADDERESGGVPELPSNLRIGYTINIQLPTTTEIAVFDAIFKSLRDNLLR